MNDMDDQDRQRLDGIETKLERMGKQLDSVYYAITGNELDGNRGMAYRLAKVETEIEGLEISLNKARWMAVGFAAGIGAAAGGLASWLLKVAG